MAKPDYVLYGALVVKGVLTYDEANALCEDHTSTHEYDRPVPINFEAGLDRAIDILTEADNDAAIDAMLNRREDDDVEIELNPCGDEDCCGECGAPLDDENRITEEDVDNALSLYFHLQDVVASFLAKW